MGCPLTSPPTGLPRDPRSRTSEAAGNSRFPLIKAKPPRFRRELGQAWLLLGQGENGAKLEKQGLGMVSSLSSMSQGRNGSCCRVEALGHLLTHLCPGDPQKLESEWAPQLQAHCSSSSSRFSSSLNLHCGSWQSCALPSSHLCRVRDALLAFIIAHPLGSRPAVVSLFAPLVPLSCLFHPLFPSGFPALECTRPFPAGRGIWNPASPDVCVDGEPTCQWECWEAVGVPEWYWEGKYPSGGKPNPGEGIRSSSEGCLRLLMCIQPHQG